MKYDQRKAAIEQMEALEEMAAVAVAQTNMVHGANNAVYNSFDKSAARIGEDDLPSFMRVNDSKSKWNHSRGVLDSDDSFRAPGNDNVSETDAMQVNLKRQNLI